MDDKRFWEELERATWVVWDKRREYCYVRIPGKGGQIFHYREGRARRLARGPRALILARRLGIAPSEEQRGA